MLERWTEDRCVVHIHIQRPLAGAAAATTAAPAGTSLPPTAQAMAAGWASGGEPALQAGEGGLAGRAAFQLSSQLQAMLGLAAAEEAESQVAHAAAAASEAAGAGTPPGNQLAAAAHSCQPAAASNEPRQLKQEQQAATADAYESEARPDGQQQQQQQQEQQQQEQQEQQQQPPDGELRAPCKGTHDEDLQLT